MGRLVKGLCICGHRGERVSGAENTISALRHVMEAGVDMVETDVRMSSDGHLFLMHNRNLADCTDAEGTIETHTKDEILRMNAAVRSDGSHPYIHSFEHPALFEDFLFLSLKHPNVILNVEFKDLPGQRGISEEFAFEAVEKAVEMVLDFGLGDRTLINSFSGRLVEHVFRKHGDKLHYHTFYPWANNGEMTIPPQEFCEVVCPLNWVYREDGTRALRQQDMPQQYFEELSKYDMDIIVSGGSGDEECANLEDMIRRGGSILMTDDPVKVIEHFRGRNI